MVSTAAAVLQLLYEVQVAQVDGVGHAGKAHAVLCAELCDACTDACDGVAELCHTDAEILRQLADGKLRTGANAGDGLAGPCVVVVVVDLSLQRVQLVLGLHVEHAVGVATVTQVAVAQPGHHDKVHPGVVHHHCHRVGGIVRLLHR